MIKSVRAKIHDFRFMTLKTISKIISILFMILSKVLGLRIQRAYHISELTIIASYRGAGWSCPSRLLYQPLFSQCLTGLVSPFQRLSLKYKTKDLDIILYCIREREREMKNIYYLFIFLVIVLRPKPNILAASIRFPLLADNASLRSNFSSSRENTLKSLLSESISFM